MSTIAHERIREITPQMAGMRMSPEEFDAVEQWADDCSCELVQGVLVVVPPPSEGERGPNELLGHWLLSYQEHHPRGAALDFTLAESLVSTNTGRRRADRVIWTGLGRLPNVRRDRPTIAIEFVSAGKRNVRRDYIDKRDEYLQSGIKEYWIIDRFRRQMTVYRREHDQMIELTIREHAQYSTPLLPGFQLPVGRLLEIEDGLERAGADGQAEPA